MKEAALSTATPTTQDLTGVRDLVLVLADSKRLLGTRYAEWILGSPELESGIACASMSQDEWGHARLLYALLKDVGDEVGRLEHGREPHEYCNIEALDQSPASWPEFVALNALVDSALTVQLQALTTSAYVPLRQRVGKLIEEETFHAAHGLAWARRLGSTPQGKTALSAAVRATAPVVLRWFGSDTGPAGELLSNGLVAAAPSALRSQWQQRVQPVAEATGDHTVFAREPDFTGFNEKTRRASATGPDASTIARVRGDKNRAFLLD
jgi:ring-1,2-phenylacetyl-CoA epoxidase subunit PaaC